MAIGINLGDNEEVEPFSHWNEDYEPDGSYPGESDEDDWEEDEDQDEMEINFPDYSEESKNAGRFIGLRRSAYLLDSSSRWKVCSLIPTF